MYKVEIGPSIKGWSVSFQLWEFFVNTIIPQEEFQNLQDEGFKNIHDEEFEIFELNQNVKDKATLQHDQ